MTFPNCPREPTCTKPGHLVHTGKWNAAITVITFTCAFERKFKMSAIKKKNASPPVDLLKALIDPEYKTCLGTNIG